MKIEQFYDKGLAHSSYVIISEGKAAVIDPARDPQPYYDFVKAHSAQIVAVIETHPHADFISSHVEIAATTGAPIYVSRLLGAEYAHQAFDSGDTLPLGNVHLKALNTPGHSPDSISIVITDEHGQDHAVFTGDTLFVGDVGRPDLRENVGNITAKREELARQMYDSTRQVLMELREEVVVYPAHGPGSLCGKSLSPDLSSTIGRELRENYALQPMNREKFVEVLLTDQPFIPKYFPNSVAINKKGATPYAQSIAAVPRLSSDAALTPGVLLIDSRPQAKFKAAHQPGAFNIQDGGKFETWVGSIIGPGEPFYLIAEDEKSRETVLAKLAKIGYESQVKGALLNPAQGNVSVPQTDLSAFRLNPDAYTIIDIRNESEVRGNQLFVHAINIPLPELRERVREIPRDKPVMVHCAGGYRSAAGASIIIAALPGLAVYDLSEAVTSFKPVAV